MLGYRNFFIFFVLIFWVLTQGCSLPQKRYVQRSRAPASFSVVPVMAKQASSKGYSWPIERGHVSSTFGMRHGKPHDGIDIASAYGTTLRAAHEGVVIHSGGYLRGYGKTIILLDRKSGVSTIYGHVSRVFVRKHQYVQRGEKIGQVGTSGDASGPHVHFEIRLGEVPQDPFEYLSLESGHVLKVGSAQKMTEKTENIP